MSGRASAPLLIDAPIMAASATAILSAIYHSGNPFTLSGVKSIRIRQTRLASRFENASLPTSVNQQTRQEVRSGRKRKIFKLGKCPANDTRSQSEAAESVR